MARGVNSIYEYIQETARSGKKMFAWLIDPDKNTPESLSVRLREADKGKVDLILLGGSLLVQNRITEIIQLIRKYQDIPIVLFPGNTMQINEKADAILFLSLISGRNPDYLIGRHVESSFMLKKSSLEVIPTGYLIIETGSPTSVSYMSNTTPIPYDKPEIAVCTAIAGELLGLKLIFLEGGSGAKKPVDEKIIRDVRENIDIPLFVGGGIVETGQLKKVLDAGADIVVVGNGIEKEAGLIHKFSEIIHSY